MIATRPLPHNDHYPLPGYSTPHREPMARIWGKDDTLEFTGPVGAGDAGYMGRDIGNPASMAVPYNAQPGMFRRLHETPGG